jgi:hypothetical protein
MINEIAWRRSSFSGGGSASGGNCVEAAALPDGRIAFRDSKNPANGTVFFDRASMNTWLTRIKAATA